MGEFASGLLHILWLAQDLARRETQPPNRQSRSISPRKAVRLARRKSPIHSEETPGNRGFTVLPSGLNAADQPVQAQMQAAVCGGEWQLRRLRPL